MVDHIIAFTGCPNSHLHGDTLPPHLDPNEQCTLTRCLHMHCNSCVKSYRNKWLARIPTWQRVFIHCVLFVPCRITGVALTDTFWNSCGVKEPTTCTA